MKTELNEQDKERIEQEAKHYLPSYRPDLFMYAFKAGAEYEHNYQREQHKKWADLTGELIESDRAELNEIAKIVDAIVCTAEFKKSWPRTAEVLIEKLNSLKTKT